jgi:hypothetical protein
MNFSLTISWVLQNLQPEFVGKRSDILRMDWQSLLYFFFHFLKMTQTKNQRHFFEQKFQMLLSSALHSWLWKHPNQQKLTGACSLLYYLCYHLRNVNFFFVIFMFTNKSIFPLICRHSCCCHHRQPTNFPFRYVIIVCRFAKINVNVIIGFINERKNKHRKKIMFPT